MRVQTPPVGLVPAALALFPPSAGARRISLTTHPTQNLNSPPTPQHRLDFLDGLRALAAVFVVLSHLWVTQFGMLAHQGALGLWMNWIIYSHFAVDVFIVLSGYCLILPVARAGELRGGALDFFRRRARRILPPCYAALTLAAAIYALTHLHKPFPWVALLGNLLLVQDAVQRWNMFDSPLWSVAVEWRIYFLFPAIVWLLKRHGRIAVL
ncbi:MAG: acyltransferase, partial [Capsulimonas sp.]|uniref:acyltransferase family protein n=1 Tax=Capsulimonas sp. TaxID=2494211 RepID=UPI0032655B9C